jgi:aspartate/methionine/tyrosine aminotransferase
LKNTDIHPDIKQRVERYLKEIISAGAYTESLGIGSVQRTIARYIAKNDEVDLP